VIDARDEDYRAQFDKHVRIAVQAEPAKTLLPIIIHEIRPFALGWNDHKVVERILEIHRFCVFNADEVIPLKKRRATAQSAKQLLDNLAGIGGLSAEFHEALNLLAKPAKDPSGDWGGDRRSGEPSLKKSVRRMAVRLYLEANEDPGFTPNGPLFRFANRVGELLLLGKPQPFSSTSVRADVRELKKHLLPRLGLRSFYASR
jgi:hypothetical protein